MTTILVGLALCWLGISLIVGPAVGHAIRFRREGTTEMITDEDLEYLHGILRRMDGDTEIQIGLTHWRAAELDWIVEEAQQARAWVAAGRIKNWDLIAR